MSTPVSALTSTGVCNLTVTTRRDVRGPEPGPCLLVVNVECDLTLIRVQAARWGGEKLL